jgi:hypothetical protein
VSYQPNSEEELSTSIVTFKPTKDKLDEAIKLLSEEGTAKIGLVLQNIAEGYDLLMTDFEERRRNESFPFERSSFDGFSAREFNWSRKQEETMEEVIRSLQKMREYIKFMLIGQDLRQYRRFKRLLPYYSKTNAGQFLFDHPSVNRDIDQRTTEDARFCLKFVIDLARRMQEFDDEEHQ